ncbi:MAG: TetR/AcrR family transcriptional regulator C-terminal domain-containing protein [Eubacterium sp.]|nr:TetR/AcrR family transcriptional regulator C-terminal domain-containing protein [Eubacterium sp.]
MPDTNITKSALARSMKSLMAKKSFTKISVSDICDGCGMNRKSFYYHFKDKYDLMNWMFYTDFIAMVSSRSFESGWDLLESLGEIFYKDQDFYKNALKTEGQNSFRDYFMESMAPIVSYFFEDISDEYVDRDILMTLFCDGYLSAVARWLDKGCTITPKELVNHIRKMAKVVAESV